MGTKDYHLIVNNPDVYFGKWVQRRALLRTMTTFEVAMALFWSQGRPSPPHCGILGVADHHQSASTIILVVLSLVLLPHKSKCLFETSFYEEERK